VSFENPSGARGAGGAAHGGRKGAPLRRVAPGERVVLADLEGPGTLRHVWMALPPGPPEALRALGLEVFYDGTAEPSVSVPCLDFFASPHGRPVAFDSALVSVHEGRGFNAYFPMPFRRGVRVEFSNGSPRPIPLYYQIDYTLEAEFVYCRDPQPVPRLDLATALADLSRRPWEAPHPLEAALGNL
jgi:hypothetical protein